MIHSRFSGVCLVLVSFTLALPAARAEFQVGTALRIITPDPLLPVSGGVGIPKPATEKKGELTARAIVFETRDKSAYYYNNSVWKTPFVGGDYKWLVDGGNGGRNLDARVLFFYQATVNTPAMVMKMVGVGSQ